MTLLDRPGLLVELERFSRVPSVFAADRVCLALSQATPPAIQGREGFIAHWSGSGLPWFLRPLGQMMAAGQYVVELTEPASVTAFAQAADECFTVKYCSFPRSLLPSVLTGLRESGLDEGTAIAQRDAGYAEIEFCGDHDDHHRVLVLCRGNRDCPLDLVRFFGALDALDGA